MIKLINVCKKIKNQTILSNINITFPDTGLFVICGQSGCGKTTLLNILAGLDTQYEGLYLVDGKSSNTKNGRFAYINQKNMTLADENIQSNIEISAHFSGKYVAKNEMNHMLNQYSLNHIDSKKKTRLLSGGENQRISLIMGVVKKSKVLLCDEITSKLDSNNANVVIEKLREIAKSRLVILVTHDLELVKNKYNGLIMMKDGKIISEHKRQLPKGALIADDTYSKLGLKKLFQITLNKILTKKKRVGLCVSLLSVGLVAFSLSIFISRTLKQNLNDAFSSFINKDEIIMRHKASSDKKFSNINYEEYKDVCLKYPEYFSSVGVNYKTNIDSLIRKNECKIYNENKLLAMPGLTIDKINNYEFVEENLENDEIILILNQTDFRNLCMFLKCDNKDSTAINNYLKGHSVLITFHLENSDWNYQDDISFRIVSVLSGLETKIVHSNPLFNEYVYEDLMRFKNKDEVVENVPWVLDKQYYLRTTDVKKFLKYSFRDDFFKKYYPSVYNGNIVFYEYSGLCINSNDIATNILNKVKVSNMKISTGGSYLILDESLISGFSSDFIVTNSDVLLDETIEFNSVIEKNKSIKYPTNVFLGNITNLSAKNIDFSSNLINVIGSLPKNNDEIVLSSKLAEELYKSNWENKELYVSYLRSKTTLDNVIKNDYVKSKLKVVGVVKSDRYLVYQDYYWLIDFFRDNFGIANENLIVDAVQFSAKDTLKINDILSRLNDNEIFKYKNTSENISSTIQNTLDIAQTILLAFSIFTIFMSLLMLTLILYLFNKENIRDFAAIYALGGRHRDVMNYQFFYAIFVVILSFFASSFALLSFFAVFKYANIMFFDYSFSDIANIYAVLIAFIAIISLILRIIFAFFSKKGYDITKIMQFYE